MCVSDCNANCIRSLAGVQCHKTLLQLGLYIKRHNKTAGGLIMPQTNNTTCYAMICMLHTLTPLLHGRGTSLMTPWKKVCSPWDARTPSVVWSFVKESVGLWTNLWWTGFRFQFFFQQSTNKKFHHSARLFCDHEKRDVLCQFCLWATYILNANNTHFTSLEFDFHRNQSFNTNRFQNFTECTTWCMCCVKIAFLIDFFRKSILNILWI